LVENSVRLTICLACGSLLPGKQKDIVLLTVCFSWGRTCLIRLLGREEMYCHSLPVGHGMRHDWFVWPAKDCHSLAVGHWMSPPARKKKHGYSLPIGHEMRHDG
jgi:hypothetical protein